jgi:hypothetical protein
LGGVARPDTRITHRLFEKNLLFLTHDEDFLFDEPTEALVVVSRVRQARRLAERVEIWRGAILDLTQNPRPERRFEFDGRRLVCSMGAAVAGRLDRQSATFLEMHRTEPNVCGSRCNCWTLV